MNFQKLSFIFIKERIRKWVWVEWEPPTFTTSSWWKLWGKGGLPREVGSFSDFKRANSFALLVDCSVLWNERNNLSILHNTCKWNGENNECQGPEEKLNHFTRGNDSERGKDDLPEGQISINQTCQNIAKILSNQDFSVSQALYSTLLILK